MMMVVTIPHLLRPLPLLLLLLASDRCRPAAASPSRKVDVRKCCGVSEVILESGPGGRECTPGDKVGHPNLTPRRWRGSRLQEFAINHGRPECRAGEHLTPLYHHDGGPDRLDLLANGSLTYRHMEEEGRTYSYLRYCVDRLVMHHNYSHVAEGDVVDFAYVCLDVSVSVREAVEYWVYPVGVAVSMGCLTLTFLLYSFLPQLRDLTGGQ